MTQTRLRVRKSAAIFIPLQILGSIILLTLRYTLRNMDAEDQVIMMQVALFYLIPGVLAGVLELLSYRHLFLVELVTPVLQYAGATLFVIINATGVFDSGATMSSRTTQTQLVAANQVLLMGFLGGTWLPHVLTRCLGLALSYVVLLSQRAASGD